MTLTAQPTDLFGEPLLPIEGVHLVRVSGLEHINSPTQGAMRRLVAEILRGRFAACLVYKPITIDLRGLVWMEQAAIASGINIADLPPTVGQRLDHIAVALAGAGELRATIYHFRHAEATFPTIRSLAR